MNAAAAITPEAAATGPVASGGPDRRAPTVPAAGLLAARGADAKSGEDTVVLAVGDLLGITEAFVITSGRNARQVRTIAEEVERAVKQLDGRAPMGVEGLDDARWVLLDYGDFVVHVFIDEARTYYDLEHLWSDAPRISWGAGTHGCASLH